MLRVTRQLPLVATLLVMGLVAAACTSGASTGRADLGSAAVSDDETAAEAEAGDELGTAGGDVLAEPGVVIVPTPTPEGPGPFVVATLLGETGVMAPLDGPALAGVIAEIDRLNDDGGVLGRRVEHLRFDTNSRSSIAERQMQQLLRNPPDLVIVSCDTDFSEPVLEIADAQGLLTISPCADDARYLTGALGTRNFTMGAPSERQGLLAAAVALDAYGPTALVLRDVTSPEAIEFCDGFERSFRELGGSVVYRDEFSYDTLEPVQERLAEQGGPTSFIALCSHAPGQQAGAPSIVAMVRTVGLQAPIVAGSSIDETDWFTSVPVLGEMIFVSWSSIYGNDPDDRVNDLVRRVRDLSDPLDDPLTAGVSTILGAEAVEAWARAVERAGDDRPERVAAALASFNDEPFATGEVSFVGGARMDIGRTYRVLEVAEGELTVLGLESVAD